MISGDVTGASHVKVKGIHFSFKGIVTKSSEKSKQFGVNANIVAGMN